VFQNGQKEETSRVVELNTQQHQKARLKFLSNIIIAFIGKTGSESPQFASERRFGSVCKQNRVRNSTNAAKKKTCRFPRRSCNQSGSQCPNTHMRQTPVTNWAIGHRLPDTRGPYIHIIFPPKPNTPGFVLPFKSPSSTKRSLRFPTPNHPVKRPYYSEPLV
jgi:hypothetical protein